MFNLFNSANDFGLMTQISLLFLLDYLITHSYLLSGVMKNKEDFYEIKPKKSLKENGNIKLMHQYLRQLIVHITKWWDAIYKNNEVEYIFVLPGFLVIFRKDRKQMEAVPLSDYGTLFCKKYGQSQGWTIFNDLNSAKIKIEDLLITQQVSKDMSILDYFDEHENKIHDFKFFEGIVAGFKHQLPPSSEKINVETEINVEKEKE
jgi:hypothetical protein